MGDEKMNYKIDNINTAKLKLLASIRNISVEILIKEILDDALKDIKIEKAELSKPKPTKKII